MDGSRFAETKGDATRREPRDAVCSIGFGQVRGAQCRTAKRASDKSRRKRGAQDWFRYELRKETDSFGMIVEPLLSVFCGRNKHTRAQHRQRETIRRAKV
jgi:hypothetical protein